MIFKVYYLCCHFGESVILRCVLLDTVQHERDAATLKEIQMLLRDLLECYHFGVIELGRQRVGNCLGHYVILICVHAVLYVQTL